MTKIFTAFLILSGIYTAAFAQKRGGSTQPGGNIEFGINAGFNSAYVQEANTYNQTDVVGGFNFGLSAEYYFSDRWGIKGKVIYDQKGWGNGSLDLPDGSSIEGVNFKLDYITIPLMASWHFGRMRNWYLHFGPYAGFLISAKEQYTNTDIKSALNNTDFGLDLGIGVKFPISENVKMFVELDGQSGVTNIFNSGGNGQSVQGERSSINIGFTFPVK